MTTLSIAKREFRSFFDSPAAYVVICMALVALGLLFFQFRGGFWQADRASLEMMFEWLPWGISLLVAPVITMRLIAEEKRSGTLELLITLPVRDWEVVVGKFLGAWGLVLVLIAATLLYPLLMFKAPWRLGALDMGPVVAGYVGLVFYSAACVAIGLLVSSLTESQIIAFFVTFMIVGFLQIIGSSLVIGVLPPQAQFVATFVSLHTRIAPFVRGLINTRDLVYFATLTLGCLVGSFWALERRKWV
jgi:ABC-2 type transport system permease protein